MNPLFLTSLLGLVVAGTGICRAGELNLNVILSGQIAPGVYGQVQLGNETPPPVLYAQPVMIEPVPNFFQSTVDGSVPFFGTHKFRCLCHLAMLSGTRLSS